MRPADCRELRPNRPAPPIEVDDAAFMVRGSKAALASGLFPRPRRRGRCPVLYRNGVPAGPTLFNDISMLSDAVSIIPTHAPTDRAANGSIPNDNQAGTTPSITSKICR